MTQTHQGAQTRQGTETQQGPGRRPEGRAPSEEELAEYLDSALITGLVATSRENNLEHFQGFVDHSESLHFGVEWMRDWTFADVFDLMHERVGTSADRGHLSGQDTISAAACVAALVRFAERLGRAARDGSRVLFASGHPAGMFPVYARLAAAAEAAGAEIVEVPEGFPFGNGDVRQIAKVLMVHEYGSLKHTHSPEPMRRALERLREAGAPAPELVVGDHGWAGFAASHGLPTIGFADCNDPGLFVSEAQGQIEVAVPLDDNVVPGLYGPMVDFICSRAEFF